MRFFLFFIFILSFNSCAVIPDMPYSETYQAKQQIKMNHEEAKKAQEEYKKLLETRTHQ